MMGDRLDKQIGQRFQQIWAETKPKLESGKVDIAGITENKLIDVSYIVALIVLIEAQRTNMVPQIAAIQNRLKAIDPAQYYYPPSSLHTTVLGCTRHYKERKAITEERVSKILQACSGVIQVWTEPLHLYIRGVNALPSGVFLQVFSPDGAYSRFRQGFLDALRDAGEDPIEQLDTGQIHLNIGKFTHADRDRLRKLAAEIESMRDLEVGEFLVDNVELDLTDKFQSPHTTRLIQRFNLQA